MIIWSSALDEKQLATIWTSIPWNRSPNKKTSPKPLSDLVSLLCLYLWEAWPVTSTYMRPSQMVHPPVQSYICLPCFLFWRAEDRSSSLFCPALGLILGTELLLHCLRISPPAVLWPSVILVEDRMPEVTRVRIIKFAGTSPEFLSLFIPQSVLI